MFFAIILEPFPTVTGTHQSPVALVTANAVAPATPLEPIFRWKRTNYS